MIDFLLASLLPIQKGGWVGWVIMAMALWLWYLLAIRWLAIRNADRAPQTLPSPSDLLVRQQTNSIVVVAPLLGLLGTVIGMIETFDSLQEQAMYTQNGGIAAGISQALITTQLGLMVAIPGLLIGRQLDRRQEILAENQSCNQYRSGDEITS